MTQEEKIIGFMQLDTYVPLQFGALCSVLEVPKRQQKELEALLEKLTESGTIVKTKRGRYALARSLGYIRGRYQGNERGFGFLIPDDAGLEDYFIPEEAANGALHGDIVLARKTADSSRKTEAEVIHVLERANKIIVGTYEKSRNFGFVLPDETRISRDFFVSKINARHAKNGDKVVAKVTGYGGHRRNPECEIVEVLGNGNDAGVDVLSIVRRYHLKEEFPDKVLSEVRGIPDHVLPEECNGRLDLRDRLIFTIDGDDAKDFDDAVSIELLQNGLYRLGVHIADVSHYVREKSELNREAFDRGTSVYLVDRVIPMLPTQLSNGICSLNPNVDRLTFSVFMDVDGQGKVRDYTLHKSVIHSKERMTYDTVTALLDGSATAQQKARYAHLMETLFHMRDLAEILQAAKDRRGNIDFHFDESKIILDETGRPVDILRYQTGISNGIIEEFMLLCNETVARHVSRMELPFVYRVHEEPDGEKIGNFLTLCANLGYPVPKMQKITPKALQQVLQKSEGSKAEKVISTIMLRSLKKAQYSDQNAGHFGLALSDYCHFTSPIRRYPDLVIHRILGDIIAGRLSDAKIRKYGKFVKEAAVQSSACEVTAMEAEREVDDLKKVEFMQDKVGEVYDGIISSVTSFGIFVELDNTVEGLIRMANLDDDYYHFQENTLSLLGEHTKKTYQIGDSVRIKVVKADPVLRQIDFALSAE